MSILNRYQGFEDLELNGPAAATDAATEAMIEDAVRAEIAEVQVELGQQAQEIEELKSDVAETDEAVEEVQELVEGMESLIGSGSFNSTAFSQLYNRAAKLNAKLGGTSVDRMGVESLTDAATAQVRARHGMESFTDNVKAWGKKAGDAIKHIFNIVINFFVGIFSAADKIGRRADQLSKRLEAADKLKEKVHLGAWNALFDYAKNGLKEGDENWTATYNAIAAFGKVGETPANVTLDQFNSAYATLRSAIAADAKKEVGATEKKEGDKKVLIGQSAGIRVYAEMKDGEAKDLAEAAVFARSLKINFSTGDTKALTTGEAPAKADKAALKGLIAHAKSATALLRNNKVSDAFSKSVRDKVVGSLNVLKAEDATKAKEVEQKVALVRAIYSSSSSYAQAVTRQIVRCTNWQLDAVSAHI